MWWTESPIRFDHLKSNSTPVVSVYVTENGEWDDYVEHHPASTIYHTIAWQRVIEHSFNHRCYYLIARRGSEVVGILPLVLVKSWLFSTYLVSNAFADVGGICANDLVVANALLNEAYALGQKIGADHIELRHVVEVPIEGLENNKVKVLPVLKLPVSIDELWRGFDNKLRNLIRKSQRAGLTTVWGHRELVRPFYEVYARNMRDLGTPVVSMNFFENLAEEFDQQLEIVVLYKNSLPISGAVGLYYRQTFEVPWASSRHDFLSLAPNNLLYWEILTRCIKLGLAFFSFGRSTPNSGAYIFKDQWRPEPIPLNYQFLMIKDDRIPKLSPDNPNYGLAIKLWKKIPIKISNLIGPWIAKDLA